MTDHSAIERSAATWLMRKTEADWSADDERALEAWLDKSHAHAAAFWRLEHGYARLDYLASLPPSPEDHEPPRPAPSPSRLLAVAATIVGLVCGAWLLSGQLIWNRSDDITTYSTQLGEISKIELSDGTEVSLDSQSAIRVGSSTEKRELWLDRGRAYFNVHHDAGRPFHVHAGIGEITVLGTTFAVARAQEAVSVSVLEGRVRLARTNAGRATAVLLTKGVVGTVDARSVRARTSDLRQIQDGLAWRDGMVVFSNTPVEEAIAEFNRYNKSKLVLQDKRGSTMRLDGSFRVGNIDGFSRLMEQAYGLRIKIVDPVR
jgi:transmembrane sensor